MCKTSPLFHKLTTIALAIDSFAACSFESKSTDGQTTAVASDATPVCTLKVDAPIYNDKYVPDTQVLVSNFSLSAGQPQRDDNSYLTLTTEVKNKTADQVVALNDEVTGRFPDAGLETESPLVDGKRKISVSISSPNAPIGSQIQMLGYSECAPGGTIKLSELTPVGAGSKVCTIEVDAIPQGFTTWDDAINMTEINFATNFGVMLRQVQGSGQVTIGDKLDVYQYTTSKVQATDNKYTMTIGLKSADCAVGGTVNISTFN